jgi:hypothetical protein
MKGKDIKTESQSRIYHVISNIKKQQEILIESKN